jgi:hypothetical protein
MEYWYYFWIANFLAAGCGFVIITLVVLVRGVAEFRQMFAELRHSNLSEKD